MDTELMQRLDALDAKLDRITQRQDFSTDFVRDLTPVAREAMTGLSEQLVEWEARGWFALITEVGELFDRVARGHRPEDLRELSDTALQILVTVRNANQVQPLGPLGLLGAVQEHDVQRGLAVVMEILRQLGRKSEGVSRPLAVAPSATVVSVKATAAAVCEVVEWEGQRFTGDGFLLDANAWTPALAEKMADGLGIPLTEDHWTVLRWAREDFLSSGASPNVRRMATGSGVGTKRMYALFPNTPGKSAAMIAGIPKPVGCV